MSGERRLVTVSGLPGSGTTTACKLLQARLGWGYINAGQLFRQLAVEAGIDLAELCRRAEADGQIDRQLDARMVELARRGEPLILEGRLTGWMAQRHDVPALKVWCHASPLARAQRVGQRDGQEVAEAVRAMEARETSERARYLAHHQIDIADLAIYDVLIDTERHAPNAVCAQIAAHLGS